jgi:hypothetical protein
MRGNQAMQNTVRRSPPAISAVYAGDLAHEIQEKIKFVFTKHFGCLELLSPMLFEKLIFETKDHLDSSKV